MVPLSDHSYSPTNIHSTVVAVETMRKSSQSVDVPVEKVFEVKLVTFVLGRDCFVVVCRCPNEFHLRRFLALLVYTWIKGEDSILPSSLTGPPCSN
jgi:hypothetical protein